MLFVIRVVPCTSAFSASVFQLLLAYSASVFQQRYQPTVLFRVYQYHMMHNWVYQHTVLVNVYQYHNVYFWLQPVVLVYALY